MAVRSPVSGCVLLRLPPAAQAQLARHAEREGLGSVAAVVRLALAEWLARKGDESVLEVTPAGMLADNPSDREIVQRFFDAMADRSVVGVAAQLGLNHKTLRNLRKGKGTPRRATVDRMREYLDTNGACQIPRRKRKPRKKIRHAVEESPRIGPPPPCHVPDEWAKQADDYRGGYDSGLAGGTEACPVPWTEPGSGPRRAAWDAGRRAGKLAAWMAAMNGAA